MPIGFYQFLEMFEAYLEMLEAHPEANSPESVVEGLIAVYPDVPADDIRAAWEDFKRTKESLNAFVERLRPEMEGALETFRAFIEPYEEDIEQARETAERFPFPEESLRKASLAGMIKIGDGIEEAERLGVMLAGAPKQEKRRPGRPPKSLSRIQAYNFIYSGQMSHKQAFDWLLELDGIKPFDDDDYQSQFKSFKNGYRSWKSRQNRRG